MTQLTKATSSRFRLVELDAIRGLAAMGVMLFHYLNIYNTFVGQQHTTVFPYTFEWGWMGVQIFFVISGFVIFISLDRDSTPRDFLVSRVIRLYPTYWAGIALTTTVIYFVGLEDWTLSSWQVVANFSMFQFVADIPNVDGVYWSLAEELKFYILMLTFKRLGCIDRRLLICGIWLAIAATFAIGMHLFQAGSVHLAFRSGYLMVSGSYCFWFVCGIAFYGIWKDRSDWTSYLILVLNAVYFFLPFGLRIYPSPAITFLLLAIFAGTVFFQPAFLRFQPLLYLGAISYPLYLLHQNIGYCVINLSYANGLNGYWGVALAIGTSLSLASLVHWLIERHTNRWLRKKYVNWKNRKNLQAPASGA